MFYEQRLSVDGAPTDLHAEYGETLTAVVEAVGTERAAAETEVDQATIERIADGGTPELTLAEAAQLLALREGEPDAETIEIEACEHLLLGMSTAVLDVETLAAEVDIDLDPKEIQQKIERRSPMGFDEFVHLQHAIAERTP